MQRKTQLNHMYTRSQLLQLVQPLSVWWRGQSPDNCGTISLREAEERGWEEAVAPRPNLRYI